MQQPEKKGKSRLAYERPLAARQASSPQILHQFSLHRCPHVMHCFAPVSLGMDGSEQKSGTNLEERGHGFVRRPDLHLEESSLVAVAALPGTLRPRLVGVVPLARPAKDDVPLLALKMAPRVDRRRDGILEGTRAAF